MSDRARRYAVVTALVAAAFSSMSGCATLTPPVEFASSQRATPSSLQLEAVEGRPDGLLLELSLAKDIPEGGSTLELLRAGKNSEPRVYRSIALEGAILDALTTDGVEFYDRNMTPDSLTRYQLRLLDEKGRPLAYSDLLSIDWKTPPPRPDALEGRATTTRSVELRWNAPPRTGAVIFRRNVLRENSQPARIAEVGPDSGGTFVDHGVEPGVVYAYRVSTAAHGGTVPQLGTPSEPIYIDVPHE